MKIQDRGLDGTYEWACCRYREGVRSEEPVRDLSIDADTDVAKGTSREIKNLLSS